MKITFAGVFRKSKIIGDGRVRLTAVAFPGGAAASAEHIASGCASRRWRQALSCDPQERSVRQRPEQGDDTVKVPRTNGEGAPIIIIPIGKWS